MKSQTQPITVDIWSDFICPWCWVAKKRFEQGFEQFEHPEQVIVRNYSYRIASESQPIPFRTALYQKYGGEHVAELMMNQIESTGKAERLIYNFKTMLFGDTLDAHILVAAARQDDMDDLMSERFFMAATTEGRSIFLRKELIAMAEEVGMNPQQAEKALNSTTFRDAVFEDEAKARSMGASGVPLFVINNKYALSGAQPAENFRNALRQVWNEVKATHAFTDDQICGGEGREDVNKFFPVND